MNTEAPNQALRDLASVLGDDATRELVRLFVHDFQESIRCIASGKREERVRIAHGLKSSALHMGATRLSVRMAAIEKLLGSPDQELADGELAAAIADFDAVAPDLRKYAGG